MEQEQNKTEKATPFKLEEAHRRGQVSKSADVNSVALLLVFTLIFAATSTGIAVGFIEMFHSVIPVAGSLSMNHRNLMPLLMTIAEPLLVAISPILIALIVTSALANIMQTGFVFSSHPIKPDFTRLNPAQGLKKFFNVRILFELLKVILKLGMVAALLYFGAGYILPQLLQLTAINPSLIPQRMLALVTMAGLILVAIFTVTALMDLLFSRYEFAKKMRMSRRELKDEHKRREGDPDIKSKRKQMQQEMRKRAAAVQRVNEADVVLVNPTHFAVALQYRPQTMRAPEVRALGAGALAMAIRKEARASGVPIIRNPALARLLYRGCRLDNPVPEAHFDALAPIYRWLMTLPGTRVINA